MDNETTIELLNSIILLRHLELDGLEPASFTKISCILKNAQYRYKPVNYDVSKVDPDSLKKVFDEILNEEFPAGLGSGINRAGGRNSESRSIPRKRKASGSDSLAQYGNSESYHLPKLISRYYAKYRNEVVDRIREEENQIVDLKREINFIGRGYWDNKLQHQDELKDIEIDVDHTFPKSDIGDAQTLEENNSCQIGNEREGKGLEQVKHLQDASYIPEEKSETTSAKHHEHGRTICTPDYFKEVIHKNLQDSSMNKRSKVGSQIRTPINPHRASTKLGDQTKEAQGHETVPELYKSSHAPAKSSLQGDSSTERHISLNENFINVKNRTSQTTSDVLSHTKIDNTRLNPSPDKSVIQRTSLASDIETNLTEEPALSPPDNINKSREQIQAKHTGDILQDHTRSPSNHQSLNMIPHDSRALPILSGIRQELSKAISIPRETLHNQKLCDVQVKDTPNTVTEQVIQFPLTPSRVDAMAKPPVAQSSKVSPVSSSIDSSYSIERSTRQLREPSSVTKWRNVEQRSPASTQPLPRPRSVSPISDHEKAPMSLESVEKRKGRKAHTLSRRSLKGQEGHGEELDMYQTRSGLRRGARLRASSAATSANSRPPKADKRTPSVTSHNDPALLEDYFPGGKEVKAEPSTPQAAESPSSHQRFTPELPRTRSRRNAPQPLKLAPTSTGRKRRSLREASVPDSTASSTSMPNRAYVAASKSFQRTSAPLMNEIMTHKHASLFSAPVKEKNAEGYRDVIFQPQDLKSIRLAISAGARAVAAAAVAAVNATGNVDITSVSGSPMAPGSSGGSGTLLLPFSPDLVPPRGIVNSAQLEQELMRMFANAVMFNPGDDGVAKDTREMFEAVAAAVDSWKQAERAAENRGRQIDDEEEVGGTPEEEGRGKRKRQ